MEDTKTRQAQAVAALLCLCLPLSQPAPADSPATISTDRPSVADYSPVVPLGALQIESGVLVTDTDTLTTVDTPEVLVRYGLLTNTELQLTVPDYFWRFPHHCPNNNAGPTLSALSRSIGECSGPTNTTSGFGDMAIGVKQHLGTLGGFDFLLIPTLSFPTGAQEFSSGGYDPGLLLPWSRSLSANWTMAGQFAAYWPTMDGSRNYTSEATLLFDRQLTTPWDAFIEYVGDFPQRGGSRQLLHVGTAYKLTPHQQIDFHAAAGVTEAAPKFYFGIGYSYLLLTR